MPHHICCCKLLLRPILNDEEKESEMAVEAPRVIFNGDEKDFWHRFVLGVLLTLDHCFATFSPHTPHGLHPPCSCLRLSSSLHSSCLLLSLISHLSFFTHQASYVVIILSWFLCTFDFIVKSNIWFNYKLLSKQHMHDVPIVRASYIVISINNLWFFARTEHRVTWNIKHASQQGVHMCVLLFFWEVVTYLIPLSYRATCDHVKLTHYTHSSVFLLL